MMSLADFIAGCLFFGVFFWVTGFACAYYLAKENFFEKYWRKGL